MAHGRRIKKKSKARGLKGMKWRKSNCISYLTTLEVDLPPAWVVTNHRSALAGKKRGKSYL